MTYRIEIFQSGKIEDLERWVNSFIQNLECDVIDVKISSATRNEPDYENSVVNTVMIVYDYKS